jgi:endonuclease/exonuclease/phosphatase family metal-dependent hydrolase
MINILSWNIQAAKGVNGVTSVDRIVHDINKLSDADVICLQEVLATADTNQFEQFAHRFPDHTPVVGAAIDRLDGNGRLQFGNLVLSRLPVLQICQHKLPQPAEPSSRHMPRQAIEVMVLHGDNPLRIVTTHLDYFSRLQRTTQVAYLMAHNAECIGRQQQPSPAGGEGQFATLAETADSVYCGDFNLVVDSPDYLSMTGGGNVSDKSPDNARLLDCWRLMYPEVAHAPTCGIFDKEQWQEGAHCRDYFFVSATLAKKVKAISVDIKTAASDHQPLCITLST